MKINFITNEDLTITSGGWSGINYNIYNQLNKYLTIKYVGPINPKMVFHEKSQSKLLRTLGLRGDFSFFSDKRLKIINDLVSKKISSDSEYDLFFGQTPWLECNFNKPYGVYMDADFQTYLSIFSKPRTFRKSDIIRIVKKEEKWLQGAKDIFVGSEWAWLEMLKYYDLKESQKLVVHTGGNVDLPANDNYKGGYNLIFISLNFEKKGGFVCVEAFKFLRAKYPAITLTIIGEKPPTDILEIDGIIYAGLLRKNNKSEFEKFKVIIENAFLLVHPTKMDTMGAVLIEAGYFGCPSIAPKSFGIPELVLNGETGYIIDLPFNSIDFAKKIQTLIDNKYLYDKMRQNTWTYTRTQLTWEVIGNIIFERIML